MSDAELRARDVYRGLPPRPLLGGGLTARVGARGWGPPAWARIHARFFARCGVPDPFDPGAEDKGVGLGEVGLAQPKRQPAPHALPPEPKKPAGPALPNVPPAPRPPPASAAPVEGRAAPRIGETRRDDTADLKRKLEEKERARRGAPPSERYRVNQPVARLPVRPELAAGEASGAAPQPTSRPQLTRPPGPGAGTPVRPGPPRPVVASSRPPVPGAPAAAGPPSQRSPVEPVASAPPSRPPTPPAPVHAPSARSEPPSPRVLAARDDADFGDPFAAGARVVRPTEGVQGSLPANQARAAGPPETPNDRRPAAPETPAAAASAAPSVPVRRPEVPRPTPPVDAPRPAAPPNRSPPKPGGAGGGLDDLFGMGADTRIRMPRKDDAPPEAARPRRPVVTDDASIAAGGIDRRPPPPKPPSVVPSPRPAGGPSGADDLPDE